MAAGAFAQKFANWSTRQITVEPFVGSHSPDGEPQLGPAVTMNCYIQEGVRLVTNMQGQQVPSMTQVYVQGGPIDPRSRITMPTTFTGHRQPPIINVSNWWDKAEFSHSEVYL